MMPRPWLPKPENRNGGFIGSRPATLAIFAAHVFTGALRAWRADRGERAFVVAVSEIISAH
jgi:hypothetical protein